MAMEIDHIVLCVNDLDEASALLEAEHALTALPGGRHPGHGTANHVVPLGSSYLELVAVADEEEARTGFFGRWVGERAARGLAPHALCLRTDDLDTVSSSLGLETATMSRTRPDGVRLDWRLAGLEQAVSEGLPFFIEWDIPTVHHPGHANLEQASKSTSVEVRLSGKVGRLEPWIGGARGVGLTEGPPEVERVTIRTGSRVIEL